MEGSCDPAFTGVREAFAANFAERGELGASVSVFVEGRRVVDLWGGWADGARTRPWQPDTLVNFYSVGKALVSLLLLRQVDAGRIELDEPVSRVWPEFEAAGKGSVTVREAMSHRAGVPAIAERLTNEDLWDFDRMTQALAAAPPWWEPGSRHAYHTNTFGHLVGELVRRTSGRSPGADLAELAASLDADVWFGLPGSEHGRCADVIWETAGLELPAWELLDALEGDQRMTYMGYFNPPGYASMGVVNTPEWRSAQIPSTNGHGTAAGVASIYRALIEPERLLSPELLAEATRAQSTGWCPTLQQDVSFGLGFQPWTDHRPFGRNAGGFGHYGTGGSLGFADPTAGVAFGYLMNGVEPGWRTDRNGALVDAVYAAL